MTRTILIFPFHIELSVIIKAINSAHTYEQIIIKIIPNQGTGLPLPLNPLNTLLTSDNLQNILTTYKKIEDTLPDLNLLFNLELDSSNLLALNSLTKPKGLFVDYFFQDGDGLNIHDIETLKKQVARLDFNYLLTERSRTQSISAENMAKIKELFDNYDTYCLGQIPLNQIEILFHERTLPSDIDDISLLQSLQTLTLPAIYYFNGIDFTMYLFGKQRYIHYQTVPEILSAKLFHKGVMQHLFKLVQQHPLCNNCQVKNRCALQGWLLPQSLTRCKILHLFSR